MESGRTSVCATKRVVKSSRPLAPAPGKNPASLTESWHASDAPAVGPAILAGQEPIFYLRGIHRYWSTPHISPELIQTLVQLKLIERAPTELGAIRLTEPGALVKNAGPSLPCRVTPHSERRATT